MTMMTCLPVLLAHYPPLLPDFLAALDAIQCLFMLLIERPESKEVIIMIIIILLILRIDILVRMVLVLVLVNDYVAFCDVLMCLCLIFELILHFGVDAVASFY